MFEVVLKKYSAVFLIAAILLALLLNFVYYREGYSNKILILLLVSLVSAGVYFFLKDRSQTRYTDISKFREQTNLDKRRKRQFFYLTDFLFLTVLIAIFAPLYLTALYEIPWQVNSDEIVIMDVAKRLTSVPATDLFGMAGHFDFPALAFAGYGYLANLIGGINLLNIRIVHASIAIIIIVLGYFFLRNDFGRLSALSGAVILGSSHALLGISRMAMRENSALFAEILALTLLIIGFKRKKMLLQFFGGAALALTLYVYTPSRIAIVIWIAFIFLALLLCKKIMPVEKIVKLSLTAFLGFMIMSAPFFITIVKTPKDTFYYSRQQFLIFSEGQKLERDWTGTDNPKDAILKNIQNGLTAFNNKMHDQGYIYPNYDHGFLDPLSGALIWIGFAIILLKIIFQTKIKYGDLLAFIGFLLIWLSFSFLITKAPNYTRLLVVLPFTTYLALTAIRAISQHATGYLKHFAVKIRPLAAGLIMTALTAVILSWNLGIFHDFVKKGFAEGNDVGSTGRYAEARKDIPGYTFYLAASAEYPYYSWGGEGQWGSWLGFFIGSEQRYKIIHPDALSLSLENAPFTIFLNKNAWSKLGAELSLRYPDLQIFNMKTDGSLLAIEMK